MWELVNIGIPVRTSYAIDMHVKFTLMQCMQSVAIPRKITSNQLISNDSEKSIIETFLLLQFIATGRFNQCTSEALGHSC